jgi:hypothetical protein
MKNRASIFAIGGMKNRAYLVLPDGLADTGADTGQSVFAAVNNLAVTVSLAYFLPQTGAAIFGGLLSSEGFEPAIVLLPRTIADERIFVGLTDDLRLSDPFQRDLGNHNSLKMKMAQHLDAVRNGSSAKPVRTKSL